MVWSVTDKQNVEWTPYFIYADDIVQNKQVNNSSDKFNKKKF